MDLKKLEIAVLAVKPGDVVVLRLLDKLSMADKARLRDEVAALLPPRVGAIILGPGVELSVLSEAKDGLPAQPAV